MNASAALRSRSSASALAIASSFSSINFASCSNCCLRHSMLRVRPLAKVLRSRATVAATSLCLAAAAPFVASDVFGATDSVVIIVLPERRYPPLPRPRPLIGDNRDPNHPVGRGELKIPSRALSGLARAHKPVGKRPLGFGLRWPAQPPRLVPRIDRAGGPAVPGKPVGG